MGARNACSFLWRILRSTLKPHVRSVPVAYLSVFNGMAISASHPLAVTAALTSQSPSQFGLNALMLPRCKPLPAPGLVVPLVWPSLAT